MAGVAFVGLSGCVGADDDDPDDDEEYDFEDQPEDASVSFESPEDGDTVQSPVEFEASVEGADLVPAGENVVGAGHLHILVDHDFYDRGEAIPGPSPDAEEDGIYHWSDAQTEDTLALPPGEHTIGLQLADGAHRAFGETDEITITVEEYDFEDQPEDASVSFESPEDGDTVQSPVEFEASVEGADLVPAGENVVGAGHLHILVDHDFYDRGEAIPGPSPDAEEDGIYHWSDAQTEDSLELEPGEYTVGLQLADGAHRAFGETDEITITVEEE